MMSVRETLSGRHLLVTGVTGFVGKVYLAMVLETIPSIGRISVLIRPRGSQSALQRFEQMVDTSPVFRNLRATHGSHLGRWLGSRIEVLEGDMEKPRCGVPGHEVRTLAESLDLVVHCAGLTDFEPDPVKAIGVNTLGSRHAAALARATGAHLIHVSTCYTAGERTGEVAEQLIPGRSPNGTRFDPKAELVAVREAIKHPKRTERVDRAMARARALGWPNIYTYSKGLAEHLTTGLTSTTIVRPAIVECAQNYPFPGWNEGLNTSGPIVWLITRAFRRFPASAHHRFDVIPVDRVARGLVLISAAAIRGEQKPVYQLGTSDLNPLTFERAVELTGLGLRRWVRKGNGSGLEKTLFRYLDPIPAKGGWFGPLKIRNWLTGAKDVLGEFDAEVDLPEWVSPDVGAALTRACHQAADRLSKPSMQVKQVEHMLRLFKPFIHDFNYVFRTAHVQELSAGLTADEQDLFGWDLDQLCWRTYWVDVQYPGLSTWSIPIMRGETVPSDPPSHPPFQLVSSAVPTRAASK